MALPEAPPPARRARGALSAADPSAPAVDANDVLDPTKHDALAAAVARLSPEDAAMFLARLEAAITKRKLQLTAYLVAMAVWLVAMLGALVYYGSHDGFVGWVFLVPFALVGAILWGFGAWSERVAARIRAAGAAGPGLGSEAATPAAAPGAGGAR